MSARKIEVKPAIIIMSRMPVPGEVKTRMQPDISPERAAELHREMLLDTIDMTTRIEGVDKFLFLAPSNGQALPIQIEIPDDRVFNQRGEGLGERMLNSISDAYDRGNKPVIVIGSDCPWMQPGIVEEAIDSLRLADICIAPARDGGYCLIGMNMPVPDLFDHITWGTATVFDDTVISVEKAGLKARILQEQQDLDDVASLKDVSIVLERMAGENTGYIPRRTYEWILDHLIAQ